MAEDLNSSEYNSVPGNLVNSSKPTNEFKTIPGNPNYNLNPSNEYEMENVENDYNKLRFPRTWMMRDQRMEGSTTKTIQVPTHNSTANIYTISS